MFNGTSITTNKRYRSCEKLVSRHLLRTIEIIDFLCRYLQALSTHRTDGYLHRHIGELLDNQGDKADALQYYFDVSSLNPDFHSNFQLSRLIFIQAYRHNPCDMETLQWLASYYIEAQFPDKAVEFCAQAALVK